MTPRLALASEAPRLGEIARSAYAPYVPLIGREPPPMLQNFPEDIAAKRCWVAGRPAEGFVVAYSKGTDWHIENVAVAPEAQGRGLGRTLIAFAENEGRARGHARAALYTNAKMTANLALYPRLGYALVDRRTELGLDRVFFAKEL